ncbi:MAG: hypothetical protein AB8H12_08340 [Lewinella sp.]
MRIWQILALFIFPCLLYGQAHIVVAPASLTPLSAGAIGTAETALSSAAQNTDFEVRMAFMTSASGTGDRFEEYSGFLPADYMAFFNAPYQSSFGGDPTSLEAEHQRLLAMGVDTLGGGGENAILIVYTTVLNLRDDGTDYDQRKTVLYGNNLNTCDQRRFDQIDEFINPPTEFSPVATVTQNDVFLNWYSGNLAQATAPDYIVTGTLLFQGNVYCGGEYIYINDQQEEAVTTQSPNTPAVKLLVNPNHSVPTVNWYDELEDNATIFATKSGVNATLAFYAPTYGQFNEVRAKYGPEESTSIHVRPVNLQVKIDRTVYENQNPTPFVLSYYNNAIEFSERGSIGIRLSGNFTDAPDQLVAEGEFQTEWLPVDEVCDFKTLLSSLENIPVLANIEVEKEVQMRCPFELVGIETKVLWENHFADTLIVDSIFRQSAFDQDTLFIVTDPSNDDDPSKRHLDFHLAWKDGIEPTEEQFWTAPPSGTEPKREYSGNKQPTSIHNHNTEGGWSEVDYDSHFPAELDGFPIQDLDFGLFPPRANNWTFSTLENYTNAGMHVNKLDVTAFGYQKEKNVVFLSRNGFGANNWTTDLLPGSWVTKLAKLQWIENALEGSLSTRILDILPGAKLEPKFEIALEKSYYNSEPPNASNYYLQNVDHKLSGTFGIQLSGDGDTDFAGWPGLSFVVDIPLVGSIAGGVGVKFLAAFKPSMEVNLSKPHNLPYSIGNFQGSMGDISLTGEANIGIALFIDESIPGIEVEGSLSAELIASIGVNFVVNDQTQGYDVRLVIPIPRFQFNGSLGVNVFGAEIISAGGDDPIFEWPDEGTFAPIIFKF